MAIETTTTYANALKRVYSEEVMEWFLNTNAPWFMKLQRETKLIPVGIGSGYYWRAPLATPQSIGTPAEDGTVPTPQSPDFVQPTVTMGQFAASINVSFLLEAVGSGAGAWKAVMREQMEMALLDVTKHVNRIYAGTHGTGRIAQINANTSSSTSAVGKLPYGSLLTRPNMLVEIFSAETGGSERTTGAGTVIDKIVHSTRTWTFADAQTLTADDHMYISGSRTNATVPNGLAGLIDDGTNLTTLHGISRSTYEDFKSHVMANSGTVRNLTEDILIQATLDVRQKSGQSVDVLVMNTGQVMEYLQITRPDRRINQTGKGVPNYDTGWKDGLQFIADGKSVPIEVMEDIAPRTIYGINLSRLKRVGEQRPQWAKWGDGNIFQQGITSSTYNMTKQATLVFLSNLINTQPNAHFRIDDLSDLQLCGAGVGGSDT